MPNRIENKIHPEILEGIDNIKKSGHSEEELVRYIAHSKASMNFFSPTKEKINLLYRLFPDISKDKINSLYLEGVQEARKYSDFVLEKLKVAFEKHREQTRELTNKRGA